MPRSDDPFDRLRAAIDELAAADAADLLTEARVEARARIRATLTDALAASMLEHLQGQVPDARSPAPPAPAADAPARAPARPAPTKRTRTARTPAPATAPSPEPASPAWYVYGVINAGTDLPPSPVGVEAEEPVTILREGALAAVASQVPLEEFDETRLREHLADMTWVEATARAHERVLEHIREHATVIPMRMCTVYRTEGGVREMLLREADALTGAIERLAGKAEWGVKAFAGPSAGPDDESAGAGGSSGAAYMERKRAERERRARAMEMAEESAAEIHARLSAVADDAREIPLQRPEVSGHSGDMILNGVYLVADAAVDGFLDEVRALSGELEPEGIELVPTGPWPAYNFIPGTIGATW